MTDYDDEFGRDQEIARALGGIPVPDYEPGFWDRLDTRLEREGAPAQPATGASVFASVPQPVAVPEPEPAPIPIELTTVVPIAARVRRERRRSMGLLAAAAAVALAVLAVRIGADDPDPLQTASPFEGGTRLGPPDGTTTPVEDRTTGDAAEADQDDVDSPDPDDGGTTGEGGAADSAQIDTFTSTSMLYETRGGPAAGSTVLRTSPQTAEDTFVAWATAIQEGDADAVLALTGPRTIRYYDALGTSAEEALVDDADPDSWGAWADADDRKIQPIELGTVDGERAIGLVLDRPASDPADPDGRTYVGVPIVRGGSGWRVEPAALDPDGDAKIEVLSPEVGEQGLEDLPKGGTIKVAAKKDGRYFLGLDFSQQVSIPASDAVDGVITWNPGGQRSGILHVLVVAHIKEGQISMLAQTFETAPA